MTSDNKITEIIIQLAMLFPKTFFVAPRHRKPLKKGIQDDLVAAILKETEGVQADLIRSLVHQVLCTYCGHLYYHKACMRPGRSRVDLKGRRAGLVGYAEAIFHGQRFCALTGQKFDVTKLPRNKARNSNAGDTSSSGNRRSMLYKPFRKRKVTVRS